MPTATGRTVFVLGKEGYGNREVVVVNDGEEYNYDPSTIQAYTAQVARFPYNIPA